MKRSGIRRKTELRADPEKTREFVERGREAGARSLRESARVSIPETRKLRAAEGPLSPADWRVAVYKASGGRCIISGARADGPSDPRFDAHHVLPKGELRARGLLQRVWDPRNGVLLAEREHQRHEGAFLRVPRSKLPAVVWEFAAELDALAGTEWATVRLERIYPRRD
jgi:hypothetical protein